MKKLKKWPHEKEFDTTTLVSDISEFQESLDNTESNERINVRKALESINSKTDNTLNAIDLKVLAEFRGEASDGKETQIYEPRPLTPEDDIYEDIIEQFATAPTKPKYWFEEFGNYWSCSCGHINDGDMCSNCGLERDLLRSLFILHKPADIAGRPSKKLKDAKSKADKEEKKSRAEAMKRAKDEAEKEAESPESNKPENPEEKASAKSDADNSQTSERKFISQPKKADEIKPVKDQMTPSATNTLSNKANALVPKENGDSPGDKDGKNKKHLIIICSVILVLLLAAGGAAAYIYLAAPAMQYDQAQELQANGKYEKAIAKYEALGDYKSSEEMIWKCRIAIGDEQYVNGKFNAAIESYTTAMDLKESHQLLNKIRKCHIAIGDRYYADDEFEASLKSYATAKEIKDSDELQEKVNKAKFGYVQANKVKKNSQVEAYMSQLMDIDYPGIKEIYDDYYAWHVKIITNTSEDDFSTDIDTASRKDIIYFHAALSGGEPSEEIELYYEVIWPNGSSQIYGLDSKWKSGSNITARFQYPVPLFGKEGKLTFKLYDRDTNQLMGTDSVALQK